MAKYIAAGIGILILVVVVLTALGLLFGWIGGGASVVSVDNVKAQYQFAYQDLNSLKATAANACGEREALADPTLGADEKTARRSQLIAYEQNYERIKAEYDARVQNVFQAKLVKPADVPLMAPTLHDAEVAIAGCPVPAIASPAQ
jgi:hypothetical protein